MPEIGVGAEAGWAGIAAALAGAAPGTTVRLDPGVYAGADTLALATGVTLAGAGAERTLLRYTGPDAALAVQDAADVAIRGLALTGWEGLTPAEELTWHIAAGTGEVAEPGLLEDLVEGGSYGGLIRIARAQHVSVVDCGILAGSGRGSCLSAFAVDRLAIRGLSASGARYGIRLISCRARVEDSACRGAGRDGIRIERHETLPDLPSVAALSGNRCHDNGQCGIVLFSSDGVLDGNECWGNTLHGIAVARSPAHPEVAFRAELTGNRCHDNGQGGIFLWSSDGVLDGNECWGNGLAGIAVQRNPAHPEIAFRGDLSGNLCHDNGRDGISLFSSDGVLTGNECWRNRQGLVVARANETPWLPSNAELAGNLCAQNIGDGILFRASGGAARRNICTGNGRNRIGFEQDPDWPAVAPPLVEDEILGREVAPGRRLDRALTEGLAAGRVAEAAQLAGFLGSGCRHCFAAFWFQDPAPASRQAAAEPATAMPGASPAPAGPSGFVLSAEGGRLAERPLALPGGGQAGGTAAAALAGIFLRLAGDLDREPRGNEVRLPQARGERVALVSPGTGAVHDLVARVDRLRRAGGTVETAGLTGAEQKAAERHALRQVVLGRPVLVDYAPRNDHAAGGAAAAPLLDAALMAGRSRWRDVPAEALRKPQVWLVAIPAALLAALPQLGPLREAAALSLWGPPAGWDLSAIALGMALPGLAVAYALLTFLNIVLPAPLQMPLGPLRGILALADQLGLAGRLDWLYRLQRSRFAERPQRRAWRHWAIRRLFGRADLATICLVNVRHWRDADLDLLDELAAARPAGSSLLLVLQVPDRCLVEQCLRLPLARSVAAGHGSGDIQVLVDDAPGALSLAGPAPGGEGRPALARLLGWLPEAGVEGRHDVAGLLESLRLDSWSAYDLLPTLVLASAPLTPFQVQKSLARAHAQVRDAFADSVEEFLRLHGDGRPAREAISETDLDNLFRYGRHAEAITACDLEFAAAGEGRRRRMLGYQRLYGHAADRRLLAAALLAAWGDEAHAQAYLARAVACGELAVLRGIDRLLAAGQAGEARRQMRSLAFLHADRVALQPAGMALPPLEAAWQGLDARMQGAGEDVAAWGRDAALLYLDYLAALQQGGEAGLGQAVAALLAAIAAALAPDPEGGPQGGPVSPRAAFVAEAATVLRPLLEVEARLSDEILDGFLQQDWHAAPPVLQQGLQALIAAHRRVPGTLVEMLRRAAGEEEELCILARHRQHGLRSLYLVAALAAGSLRARWRDDPAQRDAALLPVGRSLAEARAGLARDDHDRAALEPVAPAGAGEGDGAAAAAFMNSPGAGAVLVGILQNAPPIRRAVLPGTDEGALGRLLAADESLGRILAGRREIEPAAGDGAPWLERH